MPATLSEGPLAISCLFSDGSRAEVRLGIADGAPLGADLLVGLGELVHPHGTVDAAGTVEQYVLGARDMVRTLAGRGFSGGAGDLTAGKLTEYWMGATVRAEACTRRMLVGFDTVTGGLDARVRELAGGRAFNPQAFRRARPRPPPLGQQGRQGPAARRDHRRVGRDRACPPGRLPSRAAPRRPS